MVEEPDDIVEYDDDDYGEEKPNNDDLPKRGVSPILVIFLISGLLGLLAAGVMLASEDRQTDPNAPSGILVPRSNWVAPDFSAMTLDGDVVSLDDYRGRVVFLNFWRTDCAPCVYELPAFQTFTEEQGDDGALILALNQGESSAQISDFLGNLGIQELTVLVDEPANTRFDYGIPGFPATFVIDESGMVQFFKLGPMTVDEMYLYLDSLSPIESDNIEQG